MDTPDRPTSQYGAARGDCLIAECFLSGCWSEYRLAHQPALEPRPAATTAKWFQSAPGFRHRACATPRSVWQKAIALAQPRFAPEFAAAVQKPPTSVALYRDQCPWPAPTATRQQALRASCPHSCHAGQRFGGSARGARQTNLYLLAAGCMDAAGCAGAGCGCSGAGCSAD